MSYEMSLQTKKYNSGMFCYQNKYDEIKISENITPIILSCKSWQYWGLLRHSYFF